MAQAEAKKGPFYLAVGRILESWTALQVAIAHGFGGADSSAKAAWMVGATEQWFKENNDLDPYEVDEFLAEILNNEFDTVADDGSLRQISQIICQCYQLCQRGKEDELRAKLALLSKPDVSGCIQQPTVEQEDGECDDEEEEEQDMDTSVGTSTPTSTPTGDLGGAATCCPESTTNSSQQEMSSTASSHLHNGTISEADPGMKVEVAEDEEWTVVKKGKKR